MHYLVKKTNDLWLTLKAERCDQEAGDRRKKVKSRKVEEEKARIRLRLSLSLSKTSNLHLNLGLDSNLSNGNI